MADLSGEILRFINESDVPEEAVDRVLEKLRSGDSSIRFTQVDWNRLRERKPALHRFIDVMSAEAAPDDPILRGRVASSLLGMVVLSEELRQIDGEDSISRLIEENFGQDIAALYNEPGPATPAA